MNGTDERRKSMAINKELKDQYLSYMRYREMQFQTEYIFSTCREAGKELSEDGKKKLFIRVR